MIKKIKLLIGGTPNEETLNTLISIAEDEVKNYCNIDDVQPLENIIVQIVIWKYNRLGAEGITSESYNGASYAYDTDYPPSITVALNKNRRCKFI